MNSIKKFPVNRPAANALSVKRPVAPPVYRPQSTPNALLRKTGPVAPPVYRPQQAPKVLQKKSALLPNPTNQTSHTRTPLAPPVYRPDAKRVAQPKAASPQQKTAPAIHRLGQNRFAQPATTPKTQTPLAYRTKTPQPATIQRAVSPNRFSVIQRAAAKRKRADVEYKLDYVLVPDEDMASYTLHVKMRTRHFFAVLINAIYEMQAQGGDVEPAMFSDHAAAQEAKGFRLGKEAVAKIDAAHLMNVTLVPGKFPKKESAKVQDLYRQSAATTMEYQKANIGPDKLIDSQQTKTKNEMLIAAQAKPVDAGFVAAYVHKHLTALVAALALDEPGDGGILSKAREAALLAVTDDLKNIQTVISEIEAELPKK